MRATILGAGTAIPVKCYSPAGVYIQVAREHILFDAGAGTLQRLQRSGAPWHALDRIFLTHFHLDHCLDLASILFAYRLPQLKRRKTLTVYGPPGLRRLYQQLNTAFSGWIAPRGFRLILKEIQETRLRLPGYQVETRRMHHYATKAIGYRLTARGKTLAYSGDTDYCQEIVMLGHRADLLMLECSMTDEQKVAGHLTPTECGRIAAEARCRHLVLTHFYPVFTGYDIRRRVRHSFVGRLTLAQDGISFQL